MGAARMKASMRSATEKIYNDASFSLLAAFQDHAMTRTVTSRRPRAHANQR
ncbi:hypothetical protein VDR12_05235 [Xanthomonas campestris pv. campestris]|uniref:hypothetical protein n=1 Tax=Xanthomonas campestris TaxID=339 RepID=UPI0013B46008|nr:hypothetical protein [Xanthomonas campestris]MEA9642017.1 hypothetical protein [Xanthomonas campestris]MEB1356838.1 hypothetical protein [Xanthomonas campestris pv. campestris]MEB1678843.1 hypothetical protein [Xanthomonas campestris pv. campestris]MEB1845750.1 hypothetical protein [Xanthomonas campestris pv. campestris]MEB2019842.1 hypothetical protein [Xanthomonas campestris pv. campestris]